MFQKKLIGDFIPKIVTYGFICDSVPIISWIIVLNLIKDTLLILSLFKISFIEIKTYNYFDVKLLILQLFDETGIDQNWK